MGEIMYNGKKYYELEPETQDALSEVGIYTFRFYPKDDLMIVSDSCEKYFGCEKVIENARVNAPKMLLYDKDVEKIYEMLEVLDSGNKKIAMSVHSKDRTRTSRLSLTVVEFDDNGAPKVIAGIVEDLAEDLRRAGIIQALSDDYQSVYYVDFDKNIIYPYRLNESIERQYGAFFNAKPKYEAAITAYIFNTVYEDDREEMLFESSVDNLAAQLKDKNVYMHDYRAKRDGKILYCRMKAVNISEEEGLHHAVIGFADVSKEKIRELEKYAYVDIITGGDNYLRFKEKLEIGRQQGYLITMDIHSFKVVNSTCGTQKGDEVLKAIWKCLENRLERSDFAGHVNADHFAIFLATGEVEVVKRIKAITEDLEKLSIDMKIPQLIPYFGIAAWSPDSRVEIIYGEATTAKHKIKNRKDMNLAFYNLADSERLIEDKRMEDKFDGAIKNKHFEIWYQPKYEPHNSSTIGAEALVRWRDNGNLIFPGAFIPLFERNGMVKHLDEYIFRNVCIQQKEWQDAGRELIPISVNLSRASLYFRDVVKKYKAIAEEIGIDPRYVPIEITESATIDNNDIHSIVDEFHDAGFELYMDDFGTGYSSLATLNTIHFDTLKLDKSLIDYIGNYNGDKLLEHTIALAKELGMHVTAEGVENREQVEFLKNLNCDSIQGYYYSKPLPLEQFVSAMCS